MKSLRLVFAMVCAGVFLGQGVAATGPGGAGGLEGEVARLKAENAQLREELKRLKGQGEKGGAGTAMGAATVPKARVFTTMLNVLEGKVPAELRPQQPLADWYKYTESKYLKWWEGELVGMEFNMPLAVGKPDVGRSITRQPGAEWTVYNLLFESKPFTIFGADHKWHVAVPVFFGVDEAGAKRWDGVKAGTLIGVKGKVREVTFVGDNFYKDRMPVYRVVMHLADVEYGLPK